MEVYLHDVCVCLFISSWLSVFLNIISNTNTDLEPTLQPFAEPAVEPTRLVVTQLFTWPIIIQLMILQVHAVLYQRYLLVFILENYF